MHLMKYSEAVVGFVQSGVGKVFSFSFQHLQEEKCCFDLIRGRPSVSISSMDLFPSRHFDHLSEQENTGVINDLSDGQL